MAVDPTPKASDKSIVIPLNLAILSILVSRQINLFRQWCPATHLCVDLRRALIAGQRCKPVNVIAIHLLLRSEGNEGYELT